MLVKSSLKRLSLGMEGMMGRRRRLLRQLHFVLLVNSVFFSDVTHKLSSESKTTSPLHSCSPLKFGRGPLLEELRLEVVRECAVPQVQFLTASCHRGGTFRLVRRQGSPPSFSDIRGLMMLAIFNHSK